MDNTLHAAHAASQQRFRALATQFQQNHEAWHEAARVRELPCQSTRLARERALLLEIQELITAYLALIAQHHW